MPITHTSRVKGDGGGWGWGGGYFHFLFLIEINHVIPCNRDVRLKSAIKNKTEVVLRLSSSMVSLKNYYYLIDKLQICVKFLLVNHQVISCCQKLNYLRWCN